MLDLSSEYRHIKQDIDSALWNCLTHQKWIFGPEVEAFENAVADYLDVTDCVGVSSGTEALVLSLRAYAIKISGEEYLKREDEIITTPFTFTATGDAILRSGATPVFVDVDLTTYNVDTEQIKDYLSSPRRPAGMAGIIPVHLYGRPANMDEIADIAEVHNAFVLEDVAQAFGGVWKNRKLGSLGNAGAFSFFPSKNLGGFGDGGMVATNDKEIAELVRMLIRHGGKDKYNVEHIGYNGRLDTLQAAILLAKFKYVDEFNTRRRRIAAFYAEELSGIEGLSLPVTPTFAAESAAEHVFHQYTVRTTERDALQAFLKGKGIATMVYYPVPLHRMKVFAGRIKVAGDLSRSEQAAKEVLSLPIGPMQKEEDSASVVEGVKQFFSR